MKVSLATLKSLLLNNVVEIKFNRRRIKPGAAPTRRMLCTNSLALLNSTEGRIALNYKRAINSPKFNPNEKNLIITWDIFMQNYRCINMAACDMIQVIPANQQFWKYFNERLVMLSAAQKINFMNQ
jgi:hypothetical protein